MLGCENLWLVLCLWGITGIIAEDRRSRHGINSKGGADLHREKRGNKDSTNEDDSYSSKYSPRFQDQSVNPEKTKESSKKLHSSILDPEYVITHYGGYIETYTQNSSGSTRPFENMNLHWDIAVSGRSEDSYNDTEFKNSIFAQVFGEHTLGDSNSNSRKSAKKVGIPMMSMGIDKLFSRIERIKNLAQNNYSNVTKYEVNLNKDIRNMSPTELFIGVLKSYVFEKATNKPDFVRELWNYEEFLRVLFTESDRGNNPEMSVPYVFIAFPLNTLRPVTNKRMKADWSKYNPNNKKPGFESVFSDYWGPFDMNADTDTGYENGNEDDVYSAAQDTEPLFKQSEDEMEQPCYDGLCTYRNQDRSSTKEELVEESGSFENIPLNNRDFGVNHTINNNIHFEGKGNLLSNSSNLDDSNNTNVANRKNISKLQVTNDPAIVTPSPPVTLSSLLNGRMQYAYATNKSVDNAQELNINFDSGNETIQLNEPFKAEENIHQIQEEELLKGSDDISTIFVNHSNGVVYGILNIKLGTGEEPKPFLETSHEDHATYSTKRGNKQNVRYSGWAWEKPLADGKVYEMLDFDIEIDLVNLSKSIRHDTVQLLGATEVDRLVMRLIEDYSPEETTQYKNENIPHGGEL